MPTYDSDSSDDGADYSTTNVTLGYATTNPSGDDISHLGGYPSWLDSNQTPPAALARCKVCNSYMSLLLQLNADLQQHFPNDDRRLHLLCCRRKQCSKKKGSVRAFREVRKPETRDKEEKRPQEALSAKPFQALGNTLFGGTSQASTGSNANPFSLSSTSTSAAVNPFSSLTSPSTLAALPPQRPVDTPQPPIETFANKLNIGTDTKSNSETETSTEPWPDQSAFPLPFTSFYLDAYPEELEKEAVAPVKAESSKTQYDIDDSGGAGAADKDSFESSLDKTFQKFSDRIAQNPEQVLRYEFKGEPLLYSGTDDVATRFVVPHGTSGARKGIPRCEKCGSQRLFELQLVPGMIYELEKEETMDLEDGMEWGTVIVGTCVNNCGEPGKVAFREEWVGVQWEERVARK